MSFPSNASNAEFKTLSIRRASMANSTLVLTDIYQEDIIHHESFAI